MVSKNEHARRSTCPVAHGLDAIGDHWTLLVIRDLLLMGKHEYREFLESDEGISSNILSDRLSKLQGSGLLSSIPHPDSKKRKLYYLTDAGKGLIHVIVALAGWSYQNFRDEVSLPESNRHALEIGPKKFIDETLSELAQWERAHGLSTA